MASAFGSEPGRVLFLASFVLFAATGLGAAPRTLRIDSGFAQADLAGQTAFFRDPTGQKTIVEVEGLPDERWKPLPNGRLAFGASRDTFWLRIRLEKAAHVPKRLVLEVDYAPLDEVSFFSRSPTGALQEEHRGMKTASRAPRSIATPTLHLVESLPLSRTIHVRIRSEGSSIFAPLMLWEGSRYYLHAQYRNILLGVFYGIFIALLLYNSFLFLIVREVRYLLYVLFVLPVFTNTMDNFGHYSLFLPPDYIPAYNQYNTLFLTLNFFLVPFANRVLGFERTGRWFRHDIPVVVGLIAAYAVFSVVTNIQFVSLVNLSLLVMTVVYLVLSLWQLVKRKRRALLFSFALGFMTAGIVVRILMINGFLPVLPLVVAQYSVQTASAVQDILLNLALAAFVREMKVENETALNGMRALAESKHAELEKQRNDLLSNLHDFIGGQIIDLKFAFEKHEGGRKADAACDACAIRTSGDKLTAMIERLIFGLRSYVSQVAEVAKFSTDFLGSIHIILLRRYAAADRQLTFDYGEPENAWLSGDASGATIRENVFSVLQEVSNNDLKYGKGMSEWNFHLQESVLAVNFQADSTYRPGTDRVGYGSQSIQRKLSEINATGHSSSDNPFRLHILIPAAADRSGHADDTKRLQPSS